MENHQISDSFVDEVSPPLALLKTEDFIQEEENSGKNEVKTDSAVVTEQEQNEQALSVAEKSWRTNSSDSDWRTTTDTSVHSSLSSITHEVPQEVLEACDGLDDMTLDTTSISPVPHETVRRGHNRGRGRGQIGQATNSLEPPAAARIFLKGRKYQSPTSSSSSSYESDETSTSYETVTNTSSSDYEYETEFSCSCSSCCSNSDSTHSESSCSCSCHSSESSTSFESRDDLTSLPRAKRGSRIGQKGSKKVEKQCNQS